MGSIPTPGAKSCERYDMIVKKDKTLKLQGSLEEKVNQMMKQSEVVEDLRKFHNLYEDTIRAELTSLLEYSDNLAKRINKYNNFLRAKLPELCE